MNFLINAISSTVSSVILIIVASIALIAAAFIIFVVMKQSGNSDGTQALSGASSREEDESETFYGKNASSRKEQKLKLWTYISAGVLAVCCILMVILQAAFGII